uniref:Uncharacterized protein n=1 Tax=Candidatus Kentrum sp. LPFa TaxID=2126335 RepID=A0A450WIZ1_9GAMM|nr:MAG: hypothetical protein BECKLPF1236B_GA0070989_11079 [Candidatus Kentron sp. LPFa]
MELSEVMKEIRLVPEDRLPEIYDFIHSFRQDSGTVWNDTAKIMGFAGCWRDLTEEEFKDFSQEIAARRAQVFSERAGR